jgi:hypothetical protein
MRPQIFFLTGLFLAAGLAAAAFAALDFVMPGFLAEALGSAGAFLLAAP